MSMTLSEARSEARSLLEQCNAIEKKYDGEITDPEDFRQMKALLETVDELETKIGQLEDHEERKQRIRQGLEAYSQPAERVLGNGQATEVKRGQIPSPGVQFVTSNEYKSMQRDGSFKSELNAVQFNTTLLDGTSLLEWKQLMQSEAKALLRAGSGGSAFVLPDYRPGMLELLQREITILDLIPRLRTTADTISYIRQDTFTNAAAGVAEATAVTGSPGTKPESTLAFSRQTSNVETIAHWIPVTTRMLDDAPAIRGVIDTQLLLGLELELEDQVIAGDGNSPNLTGILNAGINTIAASAHDNVFDAILRARTTVRVTGHGRPNAVVLHPVDFEAFRTARENVASATLGQYLMAPPTIQGPMTLWGMAVVESEAITENTALVGDFAQGATLFDREQGSIRVGLVNEDFIRNMMRILAEMRAAFVVGRPSMFVSVTGV